MLFGPPPPPSPEWSPSDIATVIIAGVSLLVSIASVVTTFLIHRLQGAVIKVGLRFHGDFRDKSTYVANAPDPSKEPHFLATTTLKKIDTAFERFPAAKFYQTTFLRVIVTNAGRIDASVDSISYVNKQKQGVATRKVGDPSGPIPVPAQTYIAEDYLYTTLLEHAGKKAKIRFEVTLTNGKTIKTRFVKLHKKHSKP